MVSKKNHPKNEKIIENFDGVEKMCQKSDANYRKFRC